LLITADYRKWPFSEWFEENACLNRLSAFRVLSGQGANIDTTTAGGRLVFGIFAALAEFERELMRERTVAGLLAARARGRNGGRPYTMTPAKLRLAQAAMSKRDTKVGDLCKELAVTRQTLYRFVDPKGQLRADGRLLLERRVQSRLAGLDNVELKTRGFSE
jgi:DNA invertase Pin-like site-specific DNA recombinase